MYRRMTKKHVINVFLVTTTTVMYALKFDDEIEVKNKYTKVEGPRTIYMITTTRNKIYKFDRAPWKMHYAQADLWTSVEKGERYRVKGFGMRWPFFGMYPNIHNIKHLH
jgi:hypothetical protein